MGATALATMVLLIFTGCLDGKDALSGFANTNNIVIVTMFVVAAGLNRTQFIDNLSDRIVKISGGSFKRAYLGYLIIAFLLTNFLNSPLSVYAIVFPMCFAMSESFHVSPSKTMFPLAVVSVVCCCALPLTLRSLTQVCLMAIWKAMALLNFLLQLWISCMQDFPWH